jgi:hypothetical protein
LIDISSLPFGYLVFGQQDEVDVLKHCEADYDDFGHEDDPVLETHLTPLLCSTVVIEVIGVAEDGYGLDDPEGQQQAGEEEHHEGMADAAGLAVVVQFVADKPSKHEHDEAELKESTVAVAVGGVPVEGQLEGHDEIDVEEDEGGGVQQYRHSQVTICVIKPTENQGGSDLDIKGLVVADGRHH